jgi:hypothetical protein
MNLYLQAAAGRLVTGDGTDEPAVATPHPGRVEPRLVAEDGRRAVRPAEGDPHVRPQVRSRFEAPGQDRPEPTQLVREPLFTATRSRLSATCASRSTSFNPDAASGGRPSSVNAERTAAQ